MSNYSSLATDKKFSYIRFLYAAPDSGNIDLYVNGKAVEKSVGYGHFSEYLKAKAGSYTVSLYPMGTTATPLVEAEIEIEHDMIYTIAISGNDNNMSVLTVKDIPRTPAGDKSFIRFISLSPDIPDGDIIMNGKKLYDSISYKDCTNYYELEPDTYNLDLNIAGTDRSILKVPNINLKPNRYYAGYFVGHNKIQIYLPLEGTTYLKF